MDEDIRQLQAKLRRRGMDVVVLKKDTYAMTVAYLKEHWERFQTTSGSFYPPDHPVQELIQQRQALLQNILERLLEDYES